MVKQELGGVIDFASEALLDPAKVFTKRVMFSARGDERLVWSKNMRERLAKEKEEEQKQ